MTSFDSYKRAIHYADSGLNGLYYMVAGWLDGGLVGWRGLMDGLRGWLGWILVE
jgi:hypothetical protein